MFYLSGALVALISLEHNPHAKSGVQSEVRCAVRCPELPSDPALRHTRKVRFKVKDQVW